VRYIVGGIATIWVTWQLPSLLGIFLSEAIPTQWGLGFAGTLAMLGLTYGLLSERSTWTAAVVAGAAAVAAYSLPLKLNIVVAIAAAVAAGLMIEQAGHVRGAQLLPFSRSRGQDSGLAAARPESGSAGGTCRGGGARSDHDQGLSDRHLAGRPATRRGGGFAVLPVAAGRARTAARGSGGVPSAAATVRLVSPAAD
jgi:hypothetical protein